MGILATVSGTVSVVRAVTSACISIPCTSYLCLSSSWPEHCRSAADTGCVCITSAVIIEGQVLPLLRLLNLLLLHLLQLLQRVLFLLLPEEERQKGFQCL